MWLGLGTNVGDRAANLARAIILIRRVVDVDALSPVYETEPFGHVDQPLFWNMVARGRTRLPPADLLTALKRAEVQMGRVATFRMGPRVIDIDILTYEDAVSDTDELVLPHPGLMERPFVLRPLLDVDPDARAPDGRRLAELPAATRLEGVRRLGDAAAVLSLPEGGPA